MSTAPGDEQGGPRVATVDGVRYTAAIDFIAAVCGCSARDAATKLSSLRCHERDGPHVSALLGRKHQFAGRGQQAIAVLAASEMEELRRYLPRRHPHGGDGRSPKRGYVYAGHSKGNGTKVGMTTRDPKLRLRDANTYIKHPYELVDFIYCDDPATLEGFIHGELDAYKVGDHNRELFELPEGFASVLFQGIKEELRRGGKVSQQMVSAAARASLQSRAMVRGTHGGGGQAGLVLRWGSRRASVFETRLRRVSRRRWRHARCKSMLRHF